MYDRHSLARTINKDAQALVTVFIDALRADAGLTGAPATAAAASMVPVLLERALFESQLTEIQALETIEAFDLLYQETLRVISNLAITSGLKRLFFNFTFAGDWQREHQQLRGIVTTLWDQIVPLAGQIDQSEALAKLVLGNAQRRAGLAIVTDRPLPATRAAVAKLFLETYSIVEIHLEWPARTGD